MEIVIEIPASYLAVLKLFASKDDLRVFLRGVSMEIGPHETHLFASNGTRLVGFRVVSEQPDLVEPLRDIILPIDALPPVPAKGTVRITIGDLIDGGYSRGVTLQVLREDGLTKLGPATVSETMDVSGVNLRRVLPERTSGEAAQFNSALFADFVKAAKLLGCKPWLINITHNRDRAALVTLSGREDFVGALMPMRGDPPQCPPAWAVSPLLARKRVAA